MHAGARVASLLITLSLIGGAQLAAPIAASANARANPKVAAEVPAAIKKKGTLTVATDASFAPMEFITPHGHTVVGTDVDLARALASVMGLRVKIVNVMFDTIIPGLASHKYDLGMSSFTDTKARERVVDFVTYYSAGTSFFVKAHGGPTIQTLADLCGHRVAVEKSTTQQADATAEDKKCTAAGKPGVTVSSFQDQQGADRALSSGQTEVGMADSPVAGYVVTQSRGLFKLSGKPYGTAPYGIAIAKHNGIAKPICDALKVLIKNGNYLAILSKWGTQAGAITHPKINGATSAQ
ncbi:MAG TPA: ABC transporter substrate-binding protein [Solirubrobacteraceae bacterium]|nr:ABC transporter substrate-binding protein [Solirubrobacteraceae bacterium]